MYLAEIKKRILKELRHEPLNLFVLAAQMHEAPFRVRAELKGLRRDRLVREQFTRDGRHVWALTERGERAAWDANQLELA